MTDTTMMQSGNPLQMPEEDILRRASAREAEERARKQNQEELDKYAQIVRPPTEKQLKEEDQKRAYDDECRRDQHGGLDGQPDDVVKEVMSRNMALDGAGSATIEDGLIKVYGPDRQLIFSIDKNSFPWEKKALIAVSQVHFLGVNTGRQAERQAIFNKIQAAQTLIFG
jgi:hypothetical protein